MLTGITYWPTVFLELLAVIQPVKKISATGNFLGNCASGGLSKKFCTMKVNQDVTNFMKQNCYV
jgi:hypothetical protein